MAPHSSTLVWKIPWTEQPGRLQSMGLQIVGHDRAISLSLFTFMHWRRQWQPTPVFLPGEPQGRGSLVGCRLWGHTESEMTEVTQQQQHVQFSGVKYIHTAAQRCSRNFFILRNRNSIPIKPNFPLAPQSLVSIFLVLIFMILTTLDTSHEEKHTVHVPL